MNTNNKRNKDNLIWIDLEMTGLNLKNDRIIEISTIVTDKNINILSEGPSIAIFQSELQLKKMNSWNTLTHTKNGLIERVKNSIHSEKSAMFETLKFISKWTYPQKSPICGNSIYYDRQFLLHYMTDLEKYFHYRCIDVSSIKELVKRWNPKILLKLKKKNLHTALNDIRESIAELIHYRKYFINLKVNK
ncbi:oligoribonuclease [Wigglesworthia glossinidia endosymbiont of Glossina morsitans morsitans (Yale colony)]|uniref:Oligoribonuclease n=1 Tax=Wigglesworthia glossinidia endosymbiont of Glossina morsitans morsitans (Yale colony) TaxID=1142511 RepID=H6Q5X1_WIGGL|nr:oligoribonuclease [Wigglesworthia glossinidia]AFA41167.1 oligoribonuclease [Wigglesworthia glossinidia endosymbiont of Glossina morsitans morsitans (Yale colony)]